MGGRRIALASGLNIGLVSKRLKRLGLNRPVGSNQTQVEKSSLSIKFVTTTRNLTTVAELLLKLLCELCGYEYLIPGPRCSYDLMVDFGGGLKKIQVKSSVGGVAFDLYRTRHNTKTTRRHRYTATEVDFFFLVDVKLNCWLIPFKLLATTNKVCPRRRFPGYQIDWIKLL